MKLFVVIPAYNEAKTISNVIKSVPRRVPGVKTVNVIVVDDCSEDNTAAVARAAGAVTVSHRLNLGAGGATLTGITAARDLGADMVVTLDADGQHDAKEIAQLVRAHRDHRADLVIGSRFLSQTIIEMPLVKRFGNNVMNLITYVAGGQLVTDSQSGFRLFGTKMLANMDGFTTSGYEFCSETIVNATRHSLAVREVPIRTIYFEGRKGQNPINGINIALKLFLKRIA